MIESSGKWWLLLLLEKVIDSLILLSLLRKKWSSGFAARSMCSRSFSWIRDIRCSDIFFVCARLLSLTTAFLPPLPTRLLCLVVVIPLVCWSYMCACVCVPLCMRVNWLMIALITCNSDIVPLLEGLCSSNPCRFEFSIFRFFAGIEPTTSGLTVPRSDQLS